MNKQNRKPLPRAELYWDADGKKSPGGSSFMYGRTNATEIAYLAQAFCRENYQVVPDGETSNGSQKYRALTVQEIVDRSIEIAELMFTELEAKGHVVFVPPHDEWPNESEVGPVGFTHHE